MSETTSETIDPKLEALWGEYEVGSLKGLKKRVAFDAPIGSCGMTIDDGHVTLSPDVSAADCIVRSSEPGLLLKLVMGEVSIVTTLLQGRLEIEGDATLAVEVAGSMPELGSRITEKTQVGGTAWPANP